MSLTDSVKLVIQSENVQEEIFISSAKAWDLYEKGLIWFDIGAEHYLIEQEKYNKYRRFFK